MTNHRFLAGIMVLAATILVACGDDEGTGPAQVTLADLAGSYDVQGFTYTADSDPTTTVNLITAANADLTVTLQASGAFSGLLNAPALTGTSSDVPLAGTLILTGGNTAEVDFDAATNTLFDDLDISFQFADPNFVWTATDVSFDFSLMNDPANAVPANLTVLLVRTS